MRRQGIGFAAALAGLTFALLASFTTSADEVPDGQLVFLPVTGTLRGDTAGSSGGTIEIRECTQGEAGLKVAGRVTGLRGGVVTVLVASDPSSGAAAKAAGRAVSAGFASSAQLSPDAQPGDFLITLPWATNTATFAVASRELLSTSALGAVTGDVVRCPR